MSTGLRELKLWQEAVALGGDVIRATRSVGRREARGVAERLGLVASAVAEAVADAHGRYDARDQQQAYRTARRNLLVLETSIAVARHAEVLSAPVAAQLTTRAGNVSRLLAGYLAFLERQIAAEEAARGSPDPVPAPAADRASSPVPGTASPPAGAPALFVEP